MRLSDAVPPVLTTAADLVDRSSAGFFAGAVAIEATDLTGADFEARFNCAVKDLASAWTPAWQSLKDAKAAVDALGATDPRAVAAAARIDHALEFVDRGYSYIARVFYDLPQPLEPRFAQLAVGRIGAAGRTIANALTDAAAAVRALAATPYSTRSIDAAACSPRNSTQRAFAHG